MPQGDSGHQERDNDWEKIFGPREESRLAPQALPPALRAAEG